MNGLDAGYWALLGVTVGALITAFALRRYVLTETARAWREAREAAKAEMAQDEWELDPWEQRGDSDGWVCAVCGCTNDHACEGGCYWVYPGLCSACAEKIANGVYDFEVGNE